MMGHEACVIVLKPVFSYGSIAWGTMRRTDQFITWDL